MALITVSHDTNSKEMKVSIDGKELSNVRGVNIYPSYEDEDEYRCVISTMSEDEDTEIKTFTQIIASETLQAKDAVQKAQASECVDHPGFVVAKDNTSSKAFSDIAGFFSKS
jgi:hypothetical protein